MKPSSNKWKVCAQREPVLFLQRTAQSLLVILWEVLQSGSGTTQIWCVFPFLFAAFYEKPSNVSLFKWKVFAAWPLHPNLLLYFAVLPSALDVRASCLPNERLQSQWAWISSSVKLLINLITNKKIARERLKFSSIYLCLRSLFCVCFSHAGTECHVVLPHTDRVFEVQWRAGGGSLQLCPGHHPHVLHTVLWHLHLLHVSKKVQDEPIFPHHCELACWANLTEQATRRGPNEVPLLPVSWAAGYRESLCFPFIQVRKLISDFAIILAILIFCGVDMLVGVDTPKLIVPSEFKVSPLLHPKHYISYGCLQKLHIISVDLCM